MDVGELVGKGNERAREDSDRFDYAVPQINQVPPDRLVADLPEDLQRLRLGNAVEGFAHPAGQAQPTQPQFLGRRDHWRCRSLHGSFKTWTGHGWGG